MFFLFLLILNGALCKLYSNINESFTWSEYYNVTNGMVYPFDVKKNSNNSYQILENINATHLKTRTNYAGGLLNDNGFYAPVRLKII